MSCLLYKDEEVAWQELWKYSQDQNALDQRNCSDSGQLKGRCLQKRGGGTNIAQQYLFTYKIANQF